MDVVCPPEDSGSTPPPAAEPRPGVDEALRRLRSENFHLKLALRHRAVIEQAKGLLAARGSTTIDAAFAQLVRAARDTNKKLVDVAASYVAEVAGDLGDEADGSNHAGDLREAVAPTPPVVHDPSRPVPDELVALLREHAARRTGPSPTTGAAALRLALAGIQDAATPRELLASVVADCVWPAGPTQGALYALQPDGALELLASVGFDRDELSIWRRVPPVLRLPVVAAAAGRPQLSGDPDATLEAFPDLAFAPIVSRALAALPVSAGGHRYAVLFLGWPAPVTFSEEDRRSLALLTEAVGDALLAMLTPGEAAPWALVAVQTAMLMEAFGVPGLLVRPAEPAPEDGASWVDVLVSEANAAAVREMTRRGDVPEDPVGRTLLEVSPWPVTDTEAVLEAVRDTLGTGLVRDLSIEAGPVRVARWQDGAVVTWTPWPAAQPEPAAGAGDPDPALEAELMLGTGSAVVDLERGTARTTPGLRRLLALPDRPDVVRADDLLGALSPSTRRRLREAMDRVLASGSPVTVRVALVTGNHVRAWLQRREPDGRPVVVVAMARQPS